MPGLGKWRPDAASAHTASNTNAHTAAISTSNTYPNTVANTTADPNANANANSDAHLLRWRCRGLPQFCGNVWRESVLP